MPVTVASYRRKPHVPCLVLLYLEPKNAHPLRLKDKSPTLRQHIDSWSGESFHHQGIDTKQKPDGEMSSTFDDRCSAHTVPQTHHTQANVTKLLLKENREHNGSGRESKQGKKLIVLLPPSLIVRIGNLLVAIGINP